MGSSSNIIESLCHFGCARRQQNRNKLCVGLCLRGGGGNITLFSDIERDISSNLYTNIAEEDSYKRKGSGFIVQCIGGLILGAYKYISMDGSSYIPCHKS